MLIKLLKRYMYCRKLTDFYECDNCKTRYPVINGQIHCNNYNITECPWYRKNSKPWTKGRGI